jgi:hypothetical protein
VLDGAWFERRVLDYIFGLRKLATFGVPAEIVERIAFRGRSVFSRSGISGKYASGGVFFGGPDCDTKCSKIKRPRNKWFTHMKWNGIMEWNNGMESVYITRTKYYRIEL